MRYLIAIGWLVLTAPLLGQTARGGNQSDACPGCRIGVSRTGQLGADSGGFNSLPTGVIAGANHYLVVFGRSRTQSPMLFPKGGGAGREFGRTGGGPGEHAGIVGGSRGPGDSVMVFDQGNGRLSIYSPEFRYVRSFPMPRAYTGVWLPSGGIVVNASIETQRAAGQPFHALGPQGEVVRSFGAEGSESVVRPSASMDRRLMASGSAGEFWTAQADGAYRVQRWSAGGERMADFPRSPDWFPTRQGPRASFSIDSPPDPVMIAVSPAGEKMVWVATLVADPEWKKGLTPRRIASAEQRPGYVVRDPAAVYDTRIELLDAQTGRVIAETRVGEAIAFALGDGLFGSVRSRDDDTSVVDLIRLTVER